MKQYVPWLDTMPPYNEATKWQVEAIAAQGQAIPQADFLQHCEVPQNFDARGVGSYWVSTPDNRAIYFGYTDLNGQQFVYAKKTDFSQALQLLATQCQMPGRVMLTPAGEYVLALPLGRDVQVAILEIERLHKADFFKS